MIPNHPLLQDRPYQSAGCDAWYDRNTLIYRHVHGLSKIDEELRGRAARDLSVPQWQYLLTGLHEHTHWFQCHGTTVGAFLSQVRHSQALQTEAFLESLTPSTRDLLSQRRRQGCPMVPFKDNIPEFDVKNEELYQFQALWYAHLLVERLFDEAQKLPHLLSEEWEWCREAIGCTIAADTGVRESDASPENHPVHQWFGCLNAHLLVPSNLQESQCLPRSLSGNEIVKRLSGGKWLTTRTLMEAAATVAEVAVIAWARAAGMMDEQLSLAWIHRRIMSAYCDPLLFLGQTVGKDSWQGVSQLIPTFTAVVDLALNPPLPPYRVQPPADEARWRWEELYPPRRFIKMLEAWHHLNPQWLDKDATTDDIRFFQESFCEYFGWISPWELRHPYTLCDEPLNFEEINSETFDHAIPSREYVLWVQSKMWDYRLQWPHLFTAPAVCYANRVAEPAQKGLYQGTTRRWSMPALSWTNSDGLSITFDDEQLGYWLILSNLHYCSLYDVACGYGRIDLSSYPPGLFQEADYDRFIRRHLYDTFDFEVE